MIQRSHKSTEDETCVNISELDIPKQNPKIKKKTLLAKKVENMRSKVMKSLDTIIDNNMQLLKSCTKTVSKCSSNSARRSQYIGVFRNGPNWQALISINNKKTYIGSYSSEQEAARAFDYNSIMLHELSARTNFAYTKLEIMSLINHFSSVNS